MDQGTSQVVEIRDQRSVNKDRASRKAFYRGMAELGRRRNGFTLVRRQVGHHAVGATPTIVAICVAGITPVVANIWRSRRRVSMRARADRLRNTIGRIVDPPDRIVVQSSVMQRTIVAVSSAAFAFLTSATVAMWLRRR